MSAANRPPSARLLAKTLLVPADPELQDRLLRLEASLSKNGAPKKGTAKNGKGGNVEEEGLSVSPPPRAKKGLSVSPLPASRKGRACLPAEVERVSLQKDGVERVSPSIKKKPSKKKPSIVC